ncbi:MAG: NRDE family protein [Aureibaculum sp.]|nr:NRDE family protein [Aureibaculum sp.]
MCTVTYIPLGKKDFILTSSRDVPFSRERASSPKKNIEESTELCYPKDGKGGGTWVGFSSKNRLICLLNGGFKYHTSRAEYKKSRGLIVKELLKIDDIRKGLNNISLLNVEQFTLTIVDWNENLELLEFVWDGKEKHLKIMSQEPHIWSSSTLYDESVKKLRLDWFADWKKNKELSQENILKFHHSAGIGDPHIDLMMDRKMGGTVSITSVIKSDQQVLMRYEDVLDKRAKTKFLYYKS